MSITEIQLNSIPAAYNVTDAAIAEMAEAYRDLSAETSEGYQEVKQAIAIVRTKRGEVEKTRKALKADALEWGRKVDGEANRITGLLTEIEEPLKEKKQAVDDEKARIRKEKEEARQREIEAELKRQREEEERIAREEREREERRLVEERKKLAAERAKLEAEQKRERERLAEERRIADEERRKIEAEKKRLREIEEDRLRKEREAEEAERSKREEEERIRKEREAEEARKKLEEAMRPDMEKLAGVARQLKTVEWPLINRAECQRIMERAYRSVEHAISILEGGSNE